MSIGYDSGKKPRRGRPAGKKTKFKFSPVLQQPEPIAQATSSVVTTPGMPMVESESSEKRIAQPQLSHLLSGDQLSYFSEDEEPSPFSNFLRQILKQDTVEITYLARELGVAENTIYRWLNGNSVPRATHLKKLLAIFPQHYNNLAYAIEQTFPGTAEALSPGVREVHKGIYRRVLELASTIDDDEARRWHITQAVFECALLHLDSERAGLAITFARLLPARDGYIHTLYEAEMRGTYPWPFSFESKAYLGSTTLAGACAMLQRTQSWDDLIAVDRLQYIIDEFERSACAHPVMRTGRIAGVLIISSSQMSYFSNPVLREAVIEYAQLLGLGLNESDFYAPSLIQLRPMPDLKWQRAKIGEVFKSRLVACARKYHLSRLEAEQFVRAEMAEEFEEMERLAQQQLRVENHPL